MSFNMQLWEVRNGKLVDLRSSALDKEERLENWIAQDASVLGLELLIIGRQVTTAYRGIIDLLAINRQGDMVVIELKKHKTPRDIVSQILDYATWVKDLGYKEINAIAFKHLKKSLPSAFTDHFNESLPETLNNNHSMIIAAAELDDASERIVQYLADDHGLNINVIFFNYFQNNEQEIVGRAWLMDPEEVNERSESRKKAPWSGYWFVNVGECERRTWKDNIRYNFLGAGGGKWFSNGLKRLQPGDKIFAYLKGVGYVGFGEVTHKAVMIDQFMVNEDGAEKPLSEAQLTAPQATDGLADPDLSEWAVRVVWRKTFSKEEAKTFKGVFANQNIACKLRHPETVEFLVKEFDVLEQ
ncbi:endonuclease NucS domain-containing protein [Desulfatibacillum aliphaticivorans]|uniref:endonuclease NucS domain-containing protein n=1 Tax=Desulfatibacillum aliphaticivorans TaxID=218208 RepID=UPI0004140E66|nr:endonuclease NucS domain-containing protein [Desulfatibacillum aliphaticivorans]